MNDKEMKLASEDIVQRINEPSQEEYEAQIVNEIVQLQELLPHLNFSSYFPKMPKRMLFNMLNEISTTREMLSNLRQMIDKPSSENLSDLVH
jgi:hypothetical protein